MSDVDDLRQRRRALETQLGALRRERELAFRANGDELVQQRAGVRHHDAGEMKEFAANEASGGPAIADLGRQIELIDEELARDHSNGLTGTGRRVLRWLRK